MSGFALSSTFWINCFTDIAEVAALAETYKWYVFVYPLFAGIGLALYGMFTGATYTAPVRNMMIMALAVFWPAEHVLVPLWGMMVYGYHSCYCWQSIFNIIFIFK